MIVKTSNYTRFSLAALQDEKIGQACSSATALTYRPETEKTLLTRLGLGVWQMVGKLYWFANHGLWRPSSPWFYIISVYGTIATFCFAILISDGDEDIRWPLLSIKGALVFSPALLVATLGGLKLLAKAAGFVYGSAYACLVSKSARY